ncbi:MAG: hypothetical protein KJP12_02410 [Acidimicrobiia bacterium]|nr:hypothetical protein [Acidimicrobiia bacterium]MBT8214048.1 hypothetical protein [Acidimicrobiia bacterium]NNF68713.1 hypothetical protein [Acidimicrobiia bacterium]NNK91267.1 hypothetical protein [Acidimicrobiia bacterium]
MTDIGLIFRRMAQALRFDRDAYVWMDFEDRASGDALLLVVVTRVLIQIGIGSPGGALGYATAVLDALVFWLIVAGGTWATATHVLQGRTGYAYVMRLVGFGYPTLLLIIPTFQILSGAGINPWPLGLLIGSIWLVFIVGHGMRYAVDFELPKAIGSGLAGIMLYLIVASILNLGF